MDDRCRPHAGHTAFMHVVQERTVNGHSRVGVACMSLGLVYLDKHNETESLYVIDSCLTSMLKRGLTVNV